MRKKLFCITLAALLLLCGCSERKQTFEDIYQIIQYQVPGIQSQIIPAKFNVLTGTTTPLCIDPLCLHGTDSDCILKNFLPTGPAVLRCGYFYFTSWDIHTEEPENITICRYDLENPTIEELWEHSTDVGFQGSMTHLITEEALYFHYTNSEKAYRLDFATGKIIPLNDGEEFPENDATGAVIDGYAYFTRQMDDPPYLGYDKNQKREVYNPTGGILWRRSLSTGKEEIVCAYPTYQLIGDLNNVLGYGVDVVGDYVVVPYTETDYSTWTEDYLEKYGIQFIHPTKNGRLVYNTQTGEINDYPETTEES